MVRGWLLLLLLLVLLPTARAQHENYAPTPPVMDPGDVRSFRDVTFAQLQGFRPLTLDLYHGGAWRTKTARDGQSGSRLRAPTGWQ
jgi:hypothetical protein